MMRKNKGFTLLEMAVVLSIIAILAAIMTPFVTNYIDQARRTRAQVDANNIAKAYTLYFRDVGFFPIFDSVAASAGAASMNCQLSGTGLVFPTSNQSEWANGLNCGTGTARLMVNYLNVIATGFGTSNTLGTAAYRGPYLDGIDGSDPWGNAYVVTSRNLSSIYPYALNWAVVVSAGPNGTLESDPMQAKSGAGSSTTFAITNDDIVAVIR
jgi:prepilin-type N-terminal cleavage/methylation domain-containing protein